MNFWETLEIVYWTALLTWCVTYLVFDLREHLTK